MSQVGIVQSPTRKGRSRRNEPRQWVQGQEPGVSLADTFLFNYQHDFDDYIEESWLPSTSAPWSTAATAQNVWSHDPSQGLMSFDASGHESTSLYTNRIDRIQSNKAQYEDTYSAPIIDGLEHQPRIQSTGQIPQDRGSDYRIQSPQPRLHPSRTPSLAVTSFEAQPAADYSHFHAFSTIPVQEGHIQSWPSPFDHHHINITTHPASQGLDSSNPSTALDLPTTSRPSETSKSGRDLSVPPAASKRKPTSPEPPAKKTQLDHPESDLSEFVVVFENAPGALASVKRRRKLDDPVRKAAKDVRKAGACHQCRFRKRTCSTGTPCNSCLKHGTSLQEIRCQRESPFVGKLMHQYFEHSSTRRVVHFDVKVPLESFSRSPQEIVMIDGVGRLSHTLSLNARRRPLSSFNNDAQGVIRRTEDSRNSDEVQDDETLDIMILEDEKLLGTQVEQWALEYTSKFVHAAGPEFYSTTIAQILGTAYVKKGLPESALVAAMLRVASLAFILRAGVKYTCTTGTQPSHRFRTIQARIDTILYQRLKLAEKDLYQMLQRLVFRSTGCLNREQVYPVALVLWQLIRILCIGASHLNNIVQRFQSKAFGPADYQYHGLKLVLSTHMALFRSSNPLLLDFEDKFNQDLVGGDQQLIKLAMQMRKVVLGFRERGFPDMKGSIAYRKEYFDQFRRVYDGL